MRQRDERPNFDQSAKCLKPDIHDRTPAGEQNGNWVFILKGQAPGTRHQANKLAVRTILPAWFDHPAESF